MRPENGEAVAAATAPGEKTRRTKLVRVKQGYADCLLREPTPKVLDGVPEEVPEEVIDNMPGDLREELRAAQDESRPYMQRLVDKDLDVVLEQCRAKGYAMEEVEVYDEDEEVDVYDDDDDEEEDEDEVDDDEEEVEVYDDEEDVVYVYDEEKDGCVDVQAAEGGAKAAAAGVAARVGVCRL